MRSCGGSAWAKACSASSCGAGRTFSPWPRLAGAASAGPEAGGGAGGAGGAPNRSSCKGKAVNNGGRGGDVRACLRSRRGRAAVFAGWDARRGVQPIAWLLASAATPHHRPGAAKTTARRVGAKSGDWTPRLLAWAPAHAAHPKHPLIPIALQRDPCEIVNRLFAPLRPVGNSRASRFVRLSIREFVHTCSRSFGQLAAEIKVGEQQVRAAVGVAGRWCHGALYRALPQGSDWRPGRYPAARTGSPPARTCANWTSAALPCSRALMSKAS